MPGFFGNAVARNARMGICDVGPGAWRALTSNLLQGGTGTQTVLSNRQWIQIQARGSGALALTFTSRAIHGDTYSTTVPAHSAHTSFIIPANSILEFPLSDDVMLWGRFQAKSGSTAGGMRVVVAEFA